MALSPLDDRYAERVKILNTIFSEYGLMKFRTIVEIKWLLALCEEGIAPPLPKEISQKIETLCHNFSKNEYAIIKTFEATTNHDVKAVEYFIREFVPKSHWSWVHFACTSEDINNLAYGLMLLDGREALMVEIEKLLGILKQNSLTWKAIPMLCRTHGQTATPSTMGKEWGIFWHRAQSIASSLKAVQITGKINGATGTYSAHFVAKSNVDWIAFSQNFVTQKLGLNWNPLTTQIEPHDQQALLLNELGRLSNVLINLCRDVWGYISLGYFGQKTITGEVGSSTMPHKVNPIDFENAEGNLKLSKGLGRTLSDELPISRWQRDLTDSTLQRNFGGVFGHFYLALKSLQKGLGKLELKEERLKADLESAPEVLTEAVQTVLRAYGHHDAYEQLKAFSRGQGLNLKQVYAFVEQLDLPNQEKEKLKQLTPSTYTGLAETLVDKFVI